MPSVAVQLVQAGHGTVINAEEGHAQNVTQVLILFLQGLQFLLPILLLLQQHFHAGM